MLTGHGDDRYLFDGEIVADFSSNVIANHPLAIPKAVQAACWDSIARYPAPNGEPLQAALANFHDLAIDQVLVSNGATEALYLLAKAFEKQSATIFTPTFAEYQDACRIHHIKTSFLPWEALSTVRDYGTALIFICNPNNPTGQALSLETIRLILQKNPTAYLVIDEAYIDFSDQCESVVPLLEQYSNLILVKSLTKSFAIPGLRLGYILAAAKLIHKITNNKMPWSNNSIALNVGLYLVKHYKQLLFDRTALRQATEAFRMAVNAIDGVEALPTSTNFFLIELKNKTSTELKAFLLNQHGILIRDAANFEGLDNRYCRLACQSAEKNYLLIEALKAWMG